MLAWQGLDTGLSRSGHTIGLVTDVPESGRLVFVLLLDGGVTETAFHRYLDLFVLFAIVTKMVGHSSTGSTLLCLTCRSRTSESILNVMLEKWTF